MTDRIAVAMSGGVDSSVAALLVTEKYGKENVIGVTMKLFCYGNEPSVEKKCCSEEAIDDAREVCKKLGIAHYVIDLEEDFKKEVIDDFISQYESGFTPNPCIRCNKFIKFHRLYEKANKVGAKYLATGHYARIRNDSKGYHLLRGVDKDKDQSYFLAVLSQKELSQVIFPIGDMKKEQVRGMAKKNKLSVSEKAESQDICFVPTSIEQFLVEKIKPKKGVIVDRSGNKVGEHQGISNYTIGQRKGLGGGYGDKMYVIKLNPSDNTVVIGKEEDLYGSELLVKNIHWITDEPDAKDKLEAKTRYQASASTCTFEKKDEKTLIKFTKKQRSITPGQTIVFYQDDEVLGSGIISLD